MEGLEQLVLGILALFFVVWLYILLPAQMAGTRNRSAFIWVLISIVASPLVAILLLLVLGNAPSNKASETSDQTTGSPWDRAKY